MTAPSPVPLDGSQPVLVEASAGTGKTYQSEGLVVRLVAEAGVPIDRLLVITFTKAATADLRRRVRHRLVLAKDALQKRQAPDGDQAIAGLLDGDPKVVEERAERIEAALRDFDRAAISTIHGFCQRTLEQLAFAADQEPGLEVLGEPSALRSQLLADAWAWAYADAKEEDVALFGDLGWTEDNLETLVVAMTGPVAPRIEPVVGDPASLVEVATRFREKRDEVASWLKGLEGVAALEALQADADVKDKHKRLVAGVAKETCATNIKKLQAWLAAGAPRNNSDIKSGDIDKWWRLSVWEAKKAPETPDSFVGREVYARVDELRALQEELWSQPLVGFARSVRERFVAELHRRGLLTYDGMLSALAERLEAEGGDGVLARAIRDRFDAALVDEFQDTDSAQWAILRTCFVHARRPFFAVGDPKQSIYSFRSADISVYLAAKAGCRTERLGTNFRSDEPLVEALNYVWSGIQDGRSPFDVPSIEYEDVEADKPLRISDLPAVAGRARRPLEVRWFDGEAFEAAAAALPSKAPAQALVARLCARECRALLVEPKARLAAGSKDREIRPGDIAVLTRTNDQCDLVRDELAHLGIPAVTASAASVFGSDAASWLLAWLDAVAQPAAEAPARLLAVTPLVGWTASTLALALAEESADSAWEDFRREIGAAAQMWSAQGFFRVLDAGLTRWQAWRTVLRSARGERAATDLRHLSELLHVEEQRSRGGPRALAEWLRRRMAEAEAEDEEQAQRLESDASAVQLVTIHSSKGLQYPITLVPFGWTAWSPKDRNGPLVYSRPQAGGEACRLVDLHGKGTPERRAALDAIGERSQQEDMRLLYVAMTRARHHVVLWTGAHDRSHTSATGRLLFPPETKLSKSRAQKPESKAADADRATTAIDGVKARLDVICAASEERVGWRPEVPPVDQVDPWEPRPGQGGDGSALPQSVRRWDSEQRLGAGWMVASYTSLSGGYKPENDEPAWREEPGADAEAPEDPAGVAEPQEEENIVSDDWRPPTDDRLELPAPGWDLPGGAATGDWLHAVLEHLEFQGEPRAKDGRSLAALVRDEGRRHGVSDAAAHARVVELVPHWLATPLDGPGGLPSGFALKDLRRADRLDELQFDLRLGVGTGRLPARGSAGPTGRIDGDATRVALEAARDDETFGGRTWLSGILDREDEQGEPRRPLPAIAGILTGFIDLTLRTGGAGADGRYWVCDYKSNQVRGPEPVQRWHRELCERPDDPAPRLRGLHYTRPLLGWAMAHSAYHLQALLYTVALHRLLKQRLGPAYDYDRHVGGHLYLFLRGMGGPDTPRLDGGSCLGVWADRWPRRAVLGLDIALSGGTVYEVRSAMDGGAR